MSSSGGEPTPTTGSQGDASLLTFQSRCQDKKLMAIGWLHPEKFPQPRQIQAGRFNQNKNPIRINQSSLASLFLCWKKRFSSPSSCCPLLNQFQPFFGGCSWVKIPTLYAFNKQKFEFKTLCLKIRLL